MVGWETPAALATASRRNPAGPPTAISASAASRIRRRASSGVLRTLLFLLEDFWPGKNRLLTIDNSVDNKHPEQVETRSRPCLHNPASTLGSARFRPSRPSAAFSPT